MDSARIVKNNVIQTLTNFLIFDTIQIANDLHFERKIFMYKRKITLLFSLLFCSSALFFSGCSPNQGKTNDSSKIQVAVSIVPEATFVEAVGKDRVEVTTMIPPGSSPETYEPTPKQMTTFSKSNLFFSIGMPLEKNQLLPNLGKKTKVVPLAEAVQKQYPDLHLGEERDPHIWLSPKRVIVMIDSIVENLSKIDPRNTAFYQKNGDTYKDQLTAVDQKIQKSLLPVKNRKFIVFHPAFGYLADDYQLEMYSLEEEGKESTPEHLRQMIDLAKSEHIKVIFYQAETDSSQSKAFAEELGGKTIRLEPLAKDYIGNLEKMISTMIQVMK